MWRWCVGASLLLALGCDSAPMPPPGPDGSAACSSDDDCSDGDFCTGAETCAPDDAAADDRGCVAGTAPCLASQTCDEAADACVSDCDVAPDADGDGVASIDCGGADCDDADANRFPGNVEVCDDEAHDEDCDFATYGARDADSDGAFDAACCNITSSGDRICGTDCDDTSASAHPTAPEVCDTRDNDCDGSVDEGFECAPGATRACSVCGRTGEGTQACDPAVCAWAPCVAEEACNACDDDGDGSIDEDFSCVRGTTVACTNACGTESVGTCSTTCEGVEACLAPAEVCNYCDDDGDGTFDDEYAMATMSDAAVFDCMRDPSFPATYESAIVTLTDATCVPVAGTFRRDARLLDTAGRSDAGGMSYVVPMGFGRLATSVMAHFRKSVTTGSTGGWSVVFIAEGTLSLRAAAPGYDRATVTRGFAVEWDFNGTSNDTLSLVRLDGTTSGSTFTGTSTDVAIGGLATSYNTQVDPGILQNLFIEYQPVVMSVPGSGSALRVSHFDPASSGIGTNNVRIAVNSTSLMGELVPGDDVTIAVVAGESSSVSTGSVRIGWEWPPQPVSFAAGQNLCASYP